MMDVLSDALSRILVPDVVRIVGTYSLEINIVRLINEWYCINNKKIFPDKYCNTVMCHNNYVFGIRENTSKIQLYMYDTYNDSVRLLTIMDNRNYYVFIINMDKNNNLYIFVRDYGIVKYNIKNNKTERFDESHSTINYNGNILNQSKVDNVSIGAK